MEFLKKKIKNILNTLGYELINKNQKIAELSKQDEELIDTISKYSMTPKIRIFKLLQSLKHLKHHDIKGDYVECGVWKGGNLILFKKFLENEDLIAELSNEKNRENKNIYGFDTFEGMTEPDVNDYDLSNNNSAVDLLKNDKNKKTNLWGVVSLEDVMDNLSNNLKDLKNIHLIKGPVEQTLTNEKNIPKNISLLRLDTDWYSSTKKELEILYEKVSHGGIIIIDDYGHWGGSKKAVDEFFKDKYVWMHYVDYACRLIIKD
jgi:O-methyltransferase